MKTNISSSQSAEQLRSVIERIESLEEQKAGIAADIRDVYAESKGSGFDVTALRQVIKLRKLDAHIRDEQEAVLETYMRAIGMKATLEEDAA